MATDILTNLEFELRWTLNEIVKDQALISLEHPKVAGIVRNLKAIRRIRRRNQKVS